MSSSLKLKKLTLLLLIITATLPQGIFFGFNATVMMHLLNSGLTPHSSVTIMSLLRSAFFIGIVLFSFLSYLSTKFLVLSCTLCAFVCQVGLVFFLSDINVFLVLATLFFITNGFLRPMMTVFVVSQSDNEEERRKVSLYVYVVLNICCMFLELITPLVYLKKDPATAYLMLSLSSLIVVILSIASLRKGKNSNKERMSLKKFLKVLKLIFSKKLQTKDADLAPLLRFPSLILSISIFYAAMEQIFSSAIVHTARMNTTIFGLRILPAQMQVVNSATVVFLSAFLTKITSSKTSRAYRFKLAGLFCALGFTTIGIFDYINTNMAQLNIVLDIISYVLLTMAEIFAYTFIMEESVVSLKEEYRAMGLSMFYIAGIFGNIIAAVMAKTWHILGLQIDIFYFTILACISLLSVFVYCKFSVSEIK